MDKSKLGLDFQKVGYAKKLAGDIAADVQKFVDGYTTVAVERTLCTSSASTASTATTCRCRMWW